MNKLGHFVCSLLTALIIFSLFGCAGGPRGKMPRIESPTESELQQDWENYTVFFRHNIAFIYKLKDNRKIILDKRWAAVSTSEMMAKSQINDSSWVRKILGPNDQMFGYLVHRSADRANVKIVSENTIQLYYHYVATCCGP